jgi:hypothetical protein
MSRDEFSGLLTVVGGIGLAAGVPPELAPEVPLVPQFAVLSLGAVAGFAATRTAGALARYVAGCRPVFIGLGVGARRWSWVTRRGALVGVTRLPIVLALSGPARYRRIRWLPAVAGVVTAVAIACWAALALREELPPWQWGFAAAALLTAAVRLVSFDVPAAWWELAAPADHDAVLGIDRVLRAEFRCDTAALLAATDPLPERPAPRLVAARAQALARLRRYDEAVALLERHARDADGYAPELVYQLACVRHEAMEAGSPAGVGALSELPEVARLIADAEGMRAAERDLAATLALVSGEYEVAERHARWLVSRHPRGRRAGHLCTVARAQAGLGRFSAAHTTLARARADDPGEPRVAYAERAITAAEGGDLTAASR